MARINIIAFYVAVLLMVAHLCMASRGASDEQDNAHLVQRSAVRNLLQRLYPQRRDSGSCTVFHSSSMFNDLNCQYLYCSSTSYITCPRTADGTICCRDDGTPDGSGDTCCGSFCNNNANGLPCHHACCNQRGDGRRCCRSDGTPDGLGDHCCTDFVSSCSNTRCGGACCTARSDGRTCCRSDGTPDGNGDACCNDFLTG